MTTNANIARAAAERLSLSVSLRWFDIAPLRVRHWQDTIEQSYKAILDGRPNRMIALPDGATTQDGKTKDKARDILNAFDDYLGRDVVWSSLDLMGVE